MARLTVEYSNCSPPVLYVRGEIDMASADQLAAALTDGLTTDPTLILDMAEVTFIDAAGLRVILQAAERLNGEGPLTLINARRVARLLDLVGLAGSPSLHVSDRAQSV